MIKAKKKNGWLERDFRLCKFITTIDLAKLTRQRTCTLRDGASKILKDNILRTQVQKMAQERYSASGSQALSE